MFEATVSAGLLPFVVDVVDVFVFIDGIVHVVKVPCLFRKQYEVCLVFQACLFCFSNLFLTEGEAWQLNNLATFDSALVSTDPDAGPVCRGNSIGPWIAILY